jgi:hypothetical protein
MKKLLCVAVFLFVPAISHAQTHNVGMAPSGNNASGGAGGGSISGGGAANVAPAISRDHGASHGVQAYKNPGPFEPTEVLPWKEAVELGMPKPQKDLATVARESREQSAKEGPARVTLTN